jgi:cytochrome c peroxidase
MLFYDARLSRSQEVSCNTCHMLDKYGIDETPVSTGFKGQKGSRNAPTVYNAAGHLTQSWDGRAPDVEEQAKGQMLNPVEMAMTSEYVVVRVLNSMPEYVAAFQAAFPDAKDPVTFDNAALAIGAFERKLVTPSRWDQYLNGDRAALTSAEKGGLSQFIEAGCAGCHNGAYVGGSMIQKLGMLKPWTRDSDPGRFAFTQNASDKMLFKVPSLRNVDRTAPYFHSGSVATLEEAVKLMAEHQNGRTLSDKQTRAIVAWLHSLTGEIPTAYIAKPALPASTATTPKPGEL